jgi:hypothetical protein
MSLHGLARPEFRTTKEKSGTRVKRSNDILQCIAMVDADEPGMDCIRGVRMLEYRKTGHQQKSRKVELKS